MFTSYVAPVLLNRCFTDMKSKFSFRLWKPFFSAVLFLSLMTARAEDIIPAASFSSFDAKARKGSAMSVVFFGGSLTGGEGASDAERTSFRALLQNYLREKYESARFSFHDASIGGTGSKLGMFRIDRDVLSHKPDLVFLDFTVEDDLDGTDRETLASYERVLRDLFIHGVPVVQILAGTKEYFGPDWKHLGPPRFRDHLEMGSFYHTGIGNSFPVFQNFLRNQRHSRAEIWPSGTVYPNDRGHRFIFESARAGLEQAIRQKKICNLTEAPVFADEFRNRLQIFPLASPLPTGWHRAKSFRPAPIATETSKSWMNEVAMVSARDHETVEPIHLNFNGTFLGILGEADEHGLGFKVFIDGDAVLYEGDDVWPTSTVEFGGGQRFFWHEITDKLKPGRHTVEIYPVFPEDMNVIEPLETEEDEQSSTNALKTLPMTKGELRIESICVAGPDPESVRNISTTPIPLGSAD